MFETVATSGFTVGWFVYAAAIGGLAGVAALGMETLLRWRGLPGRWTWVAAGVVTVVAPVGTLLLPAGAADSADVTSTFVMIDQTGSEQPLGAAAFRSEGAEAQSEGGTASLLGGVLVERLAGAAGGVAEALARPLPRSWAGGTWAMGSVLLLLLLLGTSIHTIFRARRWARAEVLDRSVLLSSTTGPAAMGAWRPRIVLPRWMLSLAVADLATVLDHEHEHVRAGDPRLLWGFVLLLVAMPWNPALWWQLGRLRAAVEADCDRRTLRRRPDVDPHRYGLLLLEASRKATGTLLPAAGLGPRARDLRRRISLLASRPKGRTTALAVAAAVGATALACDLPRPTAPADVGETTVAGLTASEGSAPPGALTGPRLADRDAFDERVRTTARLFQLQDAEGAVAMRLVVDEAGEIERVVFDHVEGSSALAAAAGELARTTRLEPATVEGRSVASVVPFWVAASEHALKASLVDPAVYRKQRLPEDQEALRRLMRSYERLSFPSGEAMLPLRSQGSPITGLVPQTDPSLHDPGGAERREALSRAAEQAYLRAWQRLSARYEPLTEPRRDETRR